MVSGFISYQTISLKELLKYDIKEKAIFSKAE